ncbi:ChrR family anti-sigma-E factor [Roseospira visakhapatnamensis]|uniref:Putative transcriptional regulator n=1 Tax=Roseospira visakhapatnamensis TaxID=390880 RepID=A0A7W6W9V4_9PROT|nr:ChrR family anti-sigma-E factor [Roseospira visakhapatnamensis]MBB4265836.1 putative transcriptional regulator [Roseospira visakhapatnamensis]
MTVKHHPSEAVLFAYAAGGLGEGLSLLVAAHLSFCPSCRRSVAEAEAVGGVMMEEIAPVAVRPDSLDRVLANLDGAPVPNRAATPAPPRPTPASAARSTDTPPLPSVLSAYVGDLSGARWQWVAPGVRQLDLVHRAQGRDSAKLLRIAPGRVLPHHGHAGLEMTVVLSGSFTDEQGRFTRGDLAELDSDAQHQPIADSGEDCICLIGTDAPLRFSGLVPRMMAPMLGF